METGLILGRLGYFNFNFWVKALHFVKLKNKNGDKIVFPSLFSLFSHPTRVIRRVILKSASFLVFVFFNYISSLINYSH